MDEIASGDGMIFEPTQDSPSRAAPGSRRAHTSVAVDTVTMDAWDQIACAFEDVAYDQTARFASGQWGAARDSHVLVRRGGKVVGGARAAILKPPGLRRGLAYMRFGPFWRRRGELAELSDYREVVSAMVEEYCVRRGHCLTIIPRANPEVYDRECTILAELGFVMRRPFADKNRYLVDATLSEAEQLKSLDQKWRYNLRKALGAGLVISMSHEEADIATFIDLHRIMVRRKKFHDGDPVHLLPDMIGGFPRDLRPRIVLARQNGRPVVGAVVALLGDTAFYVFGASDECALPLKAGYALQWWILDWLRGEGVKWYDLGGEAHEPGLRQFKKGFVGKRGSILVMSGEFDRWNALSSRLAADAIFGLRQARRAVRVMRYR